MTILNQDEEGPCFICRSAETHYSCNFDELQCYCRYCGRYKISKTCQTIIERNSDILTEFKMKAPALAYERHLKYGDDEFTIRVDYDKKVLIDEKDWLATYIPQRF